MISKKIVHAAILGMLGLVAPTPTLSWGILENAVPTQDREQWKTFLPLTVLTTGKITICLLERTKGRFDPVELKGETDIVVRAWLKHAGEQADIEWTECSVGEPNLLIVVEDIPEYPDFGAYFNWLSKHNKDYPAIFINTAFLDTTDDPPLGVEPMSGLFPDETDWLARFEEIIERPTSGLALFSDPDDQFRFGMSSSKALIHEVGHAFGLCDLYEPEIERCDDRHSSALSGLAMMQSGDDNGMITNLTHDDRLGIRAVFALYRGYLGLDLPVKKEDGR